MPFKITIVELKEETRINAPAWQPIGEKADAGIAVRVYGYPDKRPETIAVEAPVYEQTVTVLDLKRVILAVNQIILPAQDPMAVALQQRHSAP